jgi:phospholipid/cholesterol/gamma-HCH transport system substrate-binding protein
MERKGLELVVGLFLLIGLACFAYLSFNLGKVELFGSSYYDVNANFSTVGNLRVRAPVTIAGVQIGKVKNIQLVNDAAQVTLEIRNEVKLADDVIASIKTTGIIGEKYVSISPGASDEYIEAGGTIRDTQPPLDIENLLGKFVFGDVGKSGEDHQSGENL